MASLKRLYCFGCLNACISNLLSHQLFIRCFLSFPISSAYIIIQYGCRSLVGMFYSVLFFCKIKEYRFNSYALQCRKLFSFYDYHGIHMTSFVHLLIVVRANPNSFAMSFTMIPDFLISTALFLMLLILIL